MSERYSFSLTTFNPSGKLVQIEYALNAVNAGQPAVGIKAKGSDYPLFIVGLKLIFYCVLIVNL